MRRPRFIAEQARDARGWLGRLIAFIMARETWAQNLRAIAALRVREDDQVLDVGCGPGRALAALAAKAPRGRVVGADPSEVMAEVALARNRGLVRSGRVDVAIAEVAALPFAAACFDKVLCVHVVYFWPDLDAALRELARVIKPGGRMALVFRTSADTPAVESFPSEVYRFRALLEVESAAERAGFRLEGQPAQGEPVLLIATRA
ncbi:MAG: class I SAM-dependent methyltransferase [Phenylobacterium sp.]|uniref:class I SAM-dependent methyltransferase n=1 Tax=Phenylobacterium sp. TaxID=1871053 RepID=UPI001223E2D6|nr:class I SAM-dependent methyltransferase [Phenylobacterium sp.]TAJ68745.1 MAG: class I SAM-dependent methyltransferase [Phenylobacterium sp.]